jgi:hypothetical protein
MCQHTAQHRPYPAAVFETAGGQELAATVHSPRGGWQFLLSYVTFIKRSNRPCACHGRRDLCTASGASQCLLQGTQL